MFLVFTPHGFTDWLASTAVPENVFNPYAGQSEAALICRANLTHYLTLMQERRPTVLLLGEAPGYRGCRLTGIPFSSEHTLASIPFFRAADGFQKSISGSAPRREASAHIVWQTLGDLAVLPVLWNAFPFHPHRPGQAESNRSPLVGEIVLGEPFTRELLASFPIETVVAVGKKPSQALARWGIPALTVRHPAHGGGAQFRAELRRALAQGNAVAPTNETRSDSC